MTIAATVPSLVLSLVGFAVFGVGVAALAPVAFTLAGDVGGAQPSWAIARVAGFGYAGVLTSPAAIGQIAGRVGFVVAFLLSASLLLVDHSRVLGGAQDAAKSRPIAITGSRPIVGRA